MDQKRNEFLPDTEYEGKGHTCMDVDRMVNEGLAGGNVIMRKDAANIEQSVDFFPEDPPQNTEDSL
jgi:hypothetical protein